ncbi:hypothetical protein E4U35_001922 [Claviceps purpurea]|nr:hypothetical protein E4U12_005511 [Claviceps purpurea]KAG6149023.1 hypothetical protein E4U28_002612 [Claviceps purpurea]KAG6154337.1 hypothetical protein E4U37_002093 [Claviceps purpurea]KAG6167908.1 hypothetical protein E4U51_002609 [Claviceps purpurea]KAG6197652.1 hypothetical protein E4U10_008040 [Claviceps purpurea]
MKPSILTFLFGSLAAAQVMQSRLFQLVINSRSKELDGRVFSACHVGAAIETICVYHDDKMPFRGFRLNSTQDVQNTQAPAGGVIGILTWDMNTEPPIPSSMSLSINPASNVALPLFTPGIMTAQLVGFDLDDNMIIVSFLNDTVTPSATRSGYALQNWYLCTITYSSYTYVSLAWTLGREKPQNPTCVKITVKRKFV